MSSAVQLKLLTLLNVSAIKRPFELDIPGGQRSTLSPLLSTPTPTLTSTPLGNNTNEGSGSGSNSRQPSDSPLGESASARETDGQPARKKKKGVVFGGVIGPSGSGVKGKTTTTASSSTPAKKNKKDTKRDEDDSPPSTLKLNQKTLAPQSQPDPSSDSESDDLPATGSTSTSTTSTSDPFISHYSISPLILTPQTQESAENGRWRSVRRVKGAGGRGAGLGRIVECFPEGAVGREEGEGENEEEVGVTTRITPSLLSPYTALHPTPTPLQTQSLELMGTYKDVYLHGLEGQDQDEVERVRAGVMLHAVNHVLKTRRKIIRNNEKLAHAQANSTPLPPHFDARDQSFTRPKVLLLLPFRSWALHYLVTHLFPLAPKDNQIENLRPFLSSFGLPEGVEDPLEDPTKSSTYPKDHVDTFKGNSDDNFRFGIKFTRKSWRVVLPPANEEKLIGCDIIVASPLACRMASDKEGGTDSLSSIEIVVADGLDVMAMQNWEHVQFVFQNMNKIPNNPHGCDFSRVKPWYLDNQAKFLRQSILISRYDTPEFRSLFNKSLLNLQGKVRVETTNFDGVLGHVRKGVKQVFTRLRGEDALEELEIRFKFFVDTTLPALLKSAVSSSNTLIVVPSYFDFVRVTNHMRKMDKVSFAAISEYSSNQEISAARTSFFKGKKSFLVITERFHFYRRYRLRGAKTIVFYALPEHADFYAEFMASPFLPSATGKQTIDIDEAEVTSRVAYSKFDYLKLERIVGTESAKRMIMEDESKFTFV